MYDFEPARSVRRDPEPAGDGGFDRRLVDRILRTAIAIESDRQDDPPISLGRLREVAAELDISNEALTEAVRIELFGNHTQGTVGLWRSGRMTRGSLVEGAPDEVARRIDDWLIRHEGLRLRSSAGSRTTWEKDRDIITAIRFGLRLPRGTGTLRHLPAVTVHRRPVTADASTVSVTADLSSIRLAAAAAGGGVAAIGIAAGGLAAMAGSGPGPAIAVSVGGIAAGLGAGGAIFRVWTVRVGRSLERALEGFAFPTRY